MPMSYFTEFVVEDAALAWLERLGYTVLHRPDISPNEVAAEQIMRRPV
jgi:type I restriction enzyme R subunit